MMPAVAAYRAISTVQIGPKYSIGFDFHKWDPHLLMWHKEFPTVSI